MRGFKEIFIGREKRNGESFIHRNDIKNIDFMAILMMGPDFNNQ